MNSLSASTGAAARSKTVKLWFGCGTAAGLLLGLAAVAAYPNDASKSALAPRPALMETQASNVLKPDAQPDAPLPDELYRFALNVFLVPLLDDSNPPRWSDAALDFSCETGTTVLIDGAPMVPGKPIPAKAFTARWHMEGCSPLGAHSAAMSGTVELLVFQTGESFSAIVTPDSLRVDTHLGVAWLRGPFFAETALTSSHAPAQTNSQ